MATEVRIPPQNLEAEEAVLGAVLMDTVALDRVAPLLVPGMFYKEAHKRIYTAMLELQNIGDPVDTVTITNYLTKQGMLEKVGGAYYVTGLVDTLPSAANVENYARIVKQKYALREIVRAGADMMRLGYEGDMAEMGEIEARVMDLLRDPESGRMLSLEVIDREVWEGLERVAGDPGHYRGLPTGFFDLDRITGGMPRSEMIVLAARPSIGKTSLALSIAANVAAAGKWVGFISLEMSGEQLYQRLLFQTARMDSQKYNEGSLTGEDLALLNDFRDTLKSLPLVIRDNVGNRIEAVTAAARRLKIAHKIDLLVVDYLQLIRGPGEKLYESVTNVSGELKTLARRLDIPVLVCCQINRRAEERTDRKPRMSDLRDSGAIEQDADQILLIHRPEHYGVVKDKVDNDIRGRAEIIVAKNRNGRTGAAWLAFISKYAGFENLAVGM